VEIIETYSYDELNKLVKHLLKEINDLKVENQLLKNEIKIIKEQIK